jgi:hypothetical protein
MSAMKELSLSNFKNSYKMLGNKELVLPFVGAFILHSAYEAQVLFQTTQAMIKDDWGVSKIKKNDKDSPRLKLEKDFRKNNLTLAMTVALGVSPFVSRLYGGTISKKINARATKTAYNPYNPWILAALGIDVAGGALIATQKDAVDYRGYLGSALLGLGTANMFMFLQNSMLFKLDKLYESKGASAFKGKTLSELRTETQTAYSVAQAGLALGPYITSLYQAPLQKKNNLTDAESKRRSIFIPFAMLGGSVLIMDMAKIIKTGITSNALKLLKKPFGQNIIKVYGLYNGAKLINARLINLSQEPELSPNLPHKQLNSEFMPESLGSANGASLSEPKQKNETDGQVLNDEEADKPQTTAKE